MFKFWCFCEILRLFNPIKYILTIFCKRKHYPYLSLISWVRLINTASKIKPNTPVLRCLFAFISWCLILYIPKLHQLHLRHRYRKRSSLVFYTDEAPEYLERSEADIKPSKILCLRQRCLAVQCHSLREQTARMELTVHNILHQLGSVENCVFIVKAQLKDTSVISFLPCKSWVSLSDVRPDPYTIVIFCNRTSWYMFLGAGYIVMSYIAF